MAGDDFGPSQLSESQQEALGTFTAVTNQEPSAAIPLLERSQWNVQVSMLAGFGDRENKLILADRYCEVLRW